jgi:DnaK suppressor protein
MASKKAANKARKPAKPATPARTAARKSAPAHKPEARKAPASTRRGPAASVKEKPAEPARAAARAATPKPAGGTRPAAPAPAKAAPAPAKATPAPAKATPVPVRATPVPVKATAAAVKATPAKGPAPKVQPVIAVVRPAARPNEAEEAEGAEPGSLLAGPRNVKPYIAKRGEQYMGKLQSEHFREILANWKRDLMEEVDRTVSHMKDEAANFPDPNDRATQEEEFSLELRTRDRERKLIRKIDEALKRIEDGSYGYCLETGEEIGIKRLEARPVATLSIEAQERRERRERQYGDRDDRYR